jgi:alpha-tubulin suppressor-like RCC1 family protein
MSRAAPAPVGGLTDVVDVTSRANHTCAVRRNGEVHCWGDNTWGQLGDGTTDNALVPIAVPGFP